MKTAQLVLLLLTFLVIPSPVLASGTLSFGTDDTIKEIQELPGTNYKLCYHYHINYFIAGLYLVNDGYVLTEKPDPNKLRFFTDTTANRYVPLSKEKTNELQNAGLLPNPLPKYSIPTSAYIEGFSLWWILLLTIAILFLKYQVQRLWNRYTAPDP